MVFHRCLAKVEMGSSRIRRVLWRGGHFPCAHRANSCWSALSAVGGGEGGMKFLLFKALVPGMPKAAQGDHPYHYLNMMHKPRPDKLQSWDQH